MNEINWTDSSLLDVKMDYDDVVLRVQEEAAAIWQIRFHGYIGFEVTGFWDELIIDHFQIYDHHPYIDECHEGIRNRTGAKSLSQSASGCPARNQDSKNLFELTLIDECKFCVVYSSYTVVKEI